MRALATLLALVSLPTLAAGLNDTGVTQCFDGANLVACNNTNTGDAAAYPRQDARFGRDAAAATGQLTKIGGGAASFDFTPLDAAGASISLSNGLPSATPACVRDNVTGLIWEVKTPGNVNDTYTWAAAATYAATANTNSLCSYNTGWRLPSKQELRSIVHHGASNPSIDANFFPNTASNWYWTSDVYAPNPAAGAWVVVFLNGIAYADVQTDTDHVRRVRSGQ